MPKFEFKLGPGLRIALIIFSIGIVFLTGGYVGSEFKESALVKANIEVFSNDSLEARKIADKTKELKDEADEWLKHNNPYDADGNPTAEWMQFIQRQESTAKQRGDQGSIIRKITHL